MKNYFAKSKQHILITVLTILIISCGLFVGCNNSTEETLSGNEVESPVTSEATTEPEEIAESDSITEPEKATIELSADEYYVDYPLSLEDGRQVYVKIPPLVNFYPAEEHCTDVTYLDTYASSNYLITKLSVDSEASVSYEMDNGDYTFINWCIEWKEGSWSYEISEPENWENGIKAYKVDSVFGGGDKTTQYVLYYPLDGDFLVLIDINGFLGTPYLLDDGELPEENEKILDFYRTEENAFVVVNPEEVEVIISDTTDISVLENYEASVKPNEELTSGSDEEVDEATKPSSTTNTTNTSANNTTSTHIHSYTCVRTQPTCTEEGYDTWTCSCGDSYIGETHPAWGHAFGNISSPTCTYCDELNPNYIHEHSYKDGVCTGCGASDPNYVHEHDYERVVIRTAQETREVHVYFPYICRCNIGWFTYEEMKAHQDSTGWDGTCNSCGSYYYNGRETFMNQYVNPDVFLNEKINYTCPNCGGHDFTRNSVACGGWANGSVITPLTGISEYSVLQCSCGELLTENDKPGERLFPTDGGYTYITFCPDAASRTKYNIADNASYCINY